MNPEAKPPTTAVVSTTHRALSKPIATNLGAPHRRNAKR